MSTQLRLTAALLATLGALGASASQAWATTIAYWQFDSAGTLATDSSGNGNGLTNGTGVSAASGGTAPSVGYAYFDGTNPASVTTSNLALSTENQLTVEFFVKFDGTPGSLVRLFETTNDYNSANAGFSSYLDGSYWTGSYHRTGEYSQARETVGTLTGGTGLDGSGWHHVAVLYDRTAAAADAIKLYVDYNAVGGMNPSYTNALSTAFVNDKFYIAGTHGSYGAVRFKGWIDEFRISDTLLTTGQMLPFPVPEPSSFAMLLFGSVMLWAVGRKRGCRL